MGLFSKITEIFWDKTDEDEEVIGKSEPEKKVVVEEPVKEEVKKIRDEVVEEVKTDNTYTERELFRSERTFDFNVLGEEEEEEKVPPRNNVIEIEKRTSRVEIPTVVAPKVFKPSPVISPIYGILDKDYTKEEIVERDNSVKEADTRMTYDSVRKKAYGSLEDQLEDTMITTPKEVKESVDDIEEEVDKLNSKTAKIEDLINRIENTNNSVTVGELEDKAIDDNFEEETIGPEEPDDDKTITDDTLEHDLFNLIDSMYDKEE